AAARCAGPPRPLARPPRRLPRALGRRPRPPRGEGRPRRRPHPQHRAGGLRAGDGGPARHPDGRPRRCGGQRIRQARTAGAGPAVMSRTALAQRPADAPLFPNGRQISAQLSTSAYVRFEPDAVRVRPPPASHHAVTEPAYLQPKPPPAPAAKSTVPPARNTRGADDKSAKDKDEKDKGEKDKDAKDKNAKDRAAKDKGGKDGKGASGHHDAKGAKGAAAQAEKGAGRGKPSGRDEDGDGA